MAAMATLEPKTDLVAPQGMETALCNARTSMTRAVPCERHNDRYSQGPVSVHSHCVGEISWPHDEPQFVVDVRKNTGFLLTELAEADAAEADTDKIRKCVESAHV